MKIFKSLSVALLFSFLLTIGCGKEGDDMPDPKPCGIPEYEGLEPALLNLYGIVNAKELGFGLNVSDFEFHTTEGVRVKQTLNAWNKFDRMADIDSIIFNFQFKRYSLGPDQFSLPEPINTGAAYEFWVRPNSESGLEIRFSCALFECDPN